MRLDLERLRAALAAAAEVAASWLLHPAMAGLTLPGARRPVNDLALLLWVARHSETALGFVELEDAVWVWAPGGGELVPPGHHDVSALSTRLYADVRAAAIDVDPWGDSLGYPYPEGFPYPKEWCWSASLPLDDDGRRRFSEDTVGLLRALGALAELVPDCAAWCAATTHVIIPIHRARTEQFSSGSLPGLPGTVFIEPRNNAILVIEALVHESAHLRFFLAEAEEPLVDPGCTATFTSPLRPEPRPLRGIFLAYHALAFMCAIYADMRPRLRSDEMGRELALLRGKRDEALAVLTGQRAHLTRAGRSLLDDTLARTLDADMPPELHA